MLLMIRRTALALGVALLALAAPSVQAANLALDGSLIIPNVCTASGATPQTCNAISGTVTTNSLTTAGATNAAYVINNNTVVATSRVKCQVQAYGGTIVTNGYPTIMTCVPGAGTITVNITNTHATNALAGTVAIGFWVVN